MKCFIVLVELPLFKSFENGKDLGKGEHLLPRIVAAKFPVECLPEIDVTFLISAQVGVNDLFTLEQEQKAFFLSEHRIKHNFDQT